jgi:hypothetical protein
MHEQLRPGFMNEDLEEEGLCVVAPGRLGLLIACGIKGKVIYMRYQHQFIHSRKKRQRWFKEERGRDVRKSRNYRGVQHLADSI